MTKAVWSVESQKSYGPSRQPESSARYGCEGHHSANAPLHHYDYIMVRTQIQLTPDQYRRLKRWAQQRGISLSEAVRRCVDAKLDAEPGAPSRALLVREALQVAGTHDDPKGAADVAREHGQHLYDAYRR